MFLMISSQIMANSLTGEWVNCQLGIEGVDIEHHLIFKENNVEFEINAFVDREKGSEIPCKGKYGLLLGTFWHYEEENSHFSSTAFSHYMILYRWDAVTNFNKNKICGISSWKIGKRFDCTDDKSLDGELVPRGTKTKHEYLLKGNELHIVEDGKTLIYRKFDSTSGSLLLN